MTALLLLPTILGALVMAAHFLRDGALQASMGAGFAAGWDLFMTGMCLVLPWLLLVRRRAVMRLMQLLLALAAVDLALAGYDIVRMRMAEGNPDVIPPGIIMGATAGSCLVAAGLYQTRRLKARYPAAGAGA